MQNLKYIRQALIVAFISFMPAITIGQVVVGTGTPDVSAALEIQGTDRGVLFPRLTTDQRNAIVSPAFGLMVLNTSTLCLEMNIGTTSVPQWLQIGCRNGLLASIDCSGAALTGNAVAGVPVSAAGFTVSYSGGNGGVHTGQIVGSTGITGLTATLLPGNFNDGSGVLAYTLSGTPSGIGTAYFALSIGGQTCNVGYTVVPGTISMLDCNNSTVTGSLVHGVSASGVSISVPYSGGDGGYYAGHSVTSTGVTGLTATFAGGLFNTGSGAFTYQITGTPGGYGTAEFALNVAGQTCSVTANVAAGAVISLDCAAATISRSLFNGISTSGASVSVPYTGGNGGIHTGQTVSSTGVTGLTATLTAGSFANGTGNLTYSLSGTPTSEGTASFTLNIGGQTCSINIVISALVCRAKINATTYRNFMCHNLGAANTSADPFTPSWEINGGYWQWGRKEQAAAGPSGPGTDQANEAAVSGWNAIVYTNSRLSDYSKTANDPCPTGYRVPTKVQWDGLIANNTIFNLGTWSTSYTNFTSGKKFGTELFLPAAGYRTFNDGKLFFRGAYGNYYSSTEIGVFEVWGMYFYLNEIGTDDFNCAHGVSVRCIEDVPGEIGSLDCNSTVVSGSLTIGSASNVNVTLTYSGGNGEIYANQTVISTDVTGLTATLAAGNFAVGNGSLTYTITGTPASAGTAIFTVSVGGQTCNLEVPVSLPVCRAKIDATTYKNFMCHNLGAANTNADPFTPSWEINGGYWQWGRKEQAAAGPSGPGIDETNEGAVSGWNDSSQPLDSWLDAFKTVNDPCPSGYRVPTNSQWNSVISSNVISNFGTWTNSSTNYVTGKNFGTELMLPAAGLRDNADGALYDRGNSGYYLSSSVFGVGGSRWHLRLASGYTVTQYGGGIHGFSIRCIAE
jgi:uncharacterized protein (TIGR02145 family)